jgi:hypothetical protein
MPRQIVKGGLRGPAQELFPEAAKEMGRDLGMEDEQSEIAILRNEGVKKGGVKEEDWQEVENGVRANIVNAPFGSPASRYPTAEQINESATHIFHIDPTADVRSGDHLKRGARTWAVLVVGTRTEQATIYVEAKEL